MARSEAEDRKESMSNSRNLSNAAKVLIIAFIFASLGAALGHTQEAGVTGNARVDLLLRQMTLDEKISMIHGTGEDATTYQGMAGYLPSAGINRHVVGDARALQERK
jgi:hypothetical protein